MPSPSASWTSTDPAGRIQWRNYYDYGDPVAFNLDSTRVWLKANGWDHVFEFEEEHDYGFERYIFPGKAHIDYWMDPAVFGHFIQNVIRPPDPRPEAQRPDYSKPPRDSQFSRVVSFVLPYLIPAVTLFLGVYILYRSVRACTDPHGHETSLQIAHNVGGLAGLIAGMTVVTRIPRMTKNWKLRGLGLGLLVGSMVGYAQLVTAEMRAKVGMVFTSLAGVPGSGRRGRHQPRADHPDPGRGGGRQPGRRRDRPPLPQDGAQAAPDHGGPGDRRDGGPQRPGGRGVRAGLADFPGGPGFLLPLVAVGSPVRPGPGVAPLHPPPDRAELPRQGVALARRIPAPAPAFDLDPPPGPTVTGAMSPPGAPHRPFGRKWLRRAAVATAAALLAAVVAFDGFKLGGMTLPAPPPKIDRMISVPQNRRPGWDDRGLDWFHHANQGTRILPYEWFVALRQPEIGILHTPGKLADPEFLSRFGFLPGETHPRYNPDGLPIGFAIDPDFREPDTDEPPYRVVGLSCAACHTGLLTYRGDDGKRVGVRVEGGSAMVNLRLFQEAIGRALYYTQILPTRFDAFAEEVLSRQNQPNDAAHRGRLRDRLGKVVARGRRERFLTRSRAGIEHGVGRTDALGLIGNRVFGAHDETNLDVADAPVNFPPLWDAPWFDRLQYNGSIRMPLVRDIGQALGVGALVNLDPRGDRMFESTVNVANLRKIEAILGGDDPSRGLTAPSWSAAGLPPIDPVRSERGRRLYDRFCAPCHLAPWKILVAEREGAASSDWTRAGPPPYDRRFLKLRLADLERIGTDKAQALNLYRRVASAGTITVPGGPGAPGGRRGDPRTGLSPPGPVRAGQRNGPGRSGTAGGNTSPLTINRGCATGSVPGDRRTWYPPLSNTGLVRSTACGRPLPSCTTDRCPTCTRCWFPTRTATCPLPWDAPNSIRCGSATGPPRSPADGSWTRRCRAIGTPATSSAT